MQTIKIETASFFELLKNRATSMWEVFNEMMKKEEQLIIFVNKHQKEIAHYVLPNNADQLKKDQKQFAQYFKDKLKEGLNETQRS